jgi:TonB family protein
LKKILLISVFLLGGALMAQTDTTIYSFLSVDERPRWKSCDLPEASRADSCTESMLTHFLVENIQYPAGYHEWTGRVYIEFVIEADGTKSNITIRKGLVKALDEEALRVIHLLPPFIPAKIRDKYVRCRYIIPIGFQFN